MKKLSIIILAIALTQGVFAQRVGVGGGAHFGGGHYYGGGRTVIVSRPYVGLGFGGYYNPYFYGPYPGYPYGYGYRHITKLDKEIINIKDDYNDRIYSVRQDKSLSGRERRHEIRELRHERERAVEDAKVNYHKQY